MMGNDGVDPRWTGNGQKVMECGFRGSNTRPLDLQSNALPTELKPLGTAHASLGFSKTHEPLAVFNGRQEVHRSK